MEISLVIFLDLLDYLVKKKEEEEMMKILKMIFQC